MPKYKAYGLTIESVFELQGLNPGSGAPEVCVRDRVLTQELFNSRPFGEQWIIGTYLDKANVLVADGREIWVDAKKPMSEGELTGLVLGELMAAMLRQRGLLVLHACTVADSEGRAIAFVGESGWGKSTLAEYFCQQGYTLVTDDVAAIQLSDNGAFAVPSYSQVRLREDVAEQLVEERELLIPVDRHGLKQSREDHVLAEEPLPLEALFLLEPQFSDSLEIIELPKRDALMRLVAHTRSKTLINATSPGLLKRHLNECTTLLRSVPVRLLTRRRDLSDLARIRTLVEDFLPNPASSSS